MSQSDPKLHPIRSELSVPGGDLRKIEKALQSDADAVFLDLEDSVAASVKDVVRDTVVKALSQLDWGRLPRAVRINGVATQWCYRDLIAIAGDAGSRLDRIVLPKVTSAGDVAFVDRLLGQLEQQFARRDPIRLEVQIEDASGLLAVREIAKSSSRVTELTFGQGDFASATGMPATDIGIADEWDAAVTGDRWLWPRQSIVFAARAAGLRALNGPFAAYRGADGFRAYCRMSRSLGFAGVWCIHPDQIAIANDVFAPSREEIARAQLTIAVLDGELSGRQGAVGQDSVMIDEATVRMARAVLALAASIEARQ